MREQALLLIMIALIAAVLGWLLIVRPLSDARFDARQRYELAARDLARARLDTAVVEDLKRTPAAPLGEPLAAFVQQAAVDAGFPVASVQPQGSRSVLLSSDSVRSQAFFAWLRQMQKDRGLVIASLRARPNDDRTLRVQVGLRTPGP